MGSWGCGPTSLYFFCDGQSVVEGDFPLVDFVSGNKMNTPCDGGGLSEHTRFLTSVFPMASMSIANSVSPMQLAAMRFGVAMPPQEGGPIWRTRTLE